MTTANAQQETMSSLTSLYYARPLEWVPAPEHVTYKITYPPGFKMRNAGRTMTFAGAALLISGIIVYDQADKTIYTVQTSQGTYDEIDPKVALGVFMVMSGVGLTVPGIIMWSRGASKFNRYLDKQTALVFEGNSVALQYRF
jgi:cytochrome b subunit of formate dehydrogenase